ncbi:hypothetical protein [Mycolicibacterium hippocampi]|nr:hypothetical protein [Mycolicibacterium hippocampi]
MTAERHGDGWRWCWRSPWATSTTSAGLYKTQRAALAAGRRWVREHR